MSSIATIEQREPYYLQLINTALERYLSDRGLVQQDVVDAMRYSLLSGGKRIRGILLLEFCRMCGGSIDDALPFACAVEMLHAYSLIHDDLPCMDDDDMRRGQPSCHIRYGEATALLAGDALLTYSFEIMLVKSNTVPAECALRAAGILARAAGYHGMVGGQVIDLASEGKQADEQTLSLIHSMKTAALIRAASTMGCVIAGADEDKVQAADRYSEKIGLSFQIVDDILDITGTSEELGKNVGSDVQNSKTTFATLYGVQRASELAYELSDGAKQYLSCFEYLDDFIYRFTDKLTDRRR